MRATSANIGEGRHIFTNTRKDSNFKEISILALDREGGLLTQHSLPAVPEDLLYRVARIHPDPRLWWYSQLVKYVIRPKESLIKQLEVEKKKALGDSGNHTHWIGVHIRKGDKILREAKSYDPKEYMARVNDYADMRRSGENEEEAPLVYLASDDAKSLVKIRSDYTHFDFAGPRAPIPRTCCGSGFLATAIDVFMLAQSKHMVCTLSSNICRLAFELMQTLQVDGRSSLTSLDLGGWKSIRSGDFKEKAILAHIAQANHEISFEKEDIIILQHPMKPLIGYSFGKHEKTKRVGYYPNYKSEPVIITEKFPF